jgi:hypothetical protein
MTLRHISMTQDAAIGNHSVKRGGSQKRRTLRQAQGDITRHIVGLSW